MIRTVLIVSRTRMKSGVCVGAIVEQTNEMIRIHDEKGANLKEDAPFEIGERWRMDVRAAWNAREVPHIEDRVTSDWEYIEDVRISGIKEYIEDNSDDLEFTDGSLDETFEGLLTNGGSRSLYIDEDNIPGHSTQFWRTDRPLSFSEKEWNGNVKRSYCYNGFYISYIGFETPKLTLPAGTIIRLSLANWWKKSDDESERCYLQLSGWYL